VPAQNAFVTGPAIKNKIPPAFILTDTVWQFTCLLFKKACLTPYNYLKKQRLSGICSPLFKLTQLIQKGHKQMTLTKTQIVEAIQAEKGFTQKQARESVEILIELIRKSLENGEDVLLTGFGKFSVKEKTERKGRNPATGETMMLAARKVITFKSSGKLRDKVNGG
jgi:integration host factor subunit alpha